MNDEILADIRVLRLAQMYETAYEAFVVQMAKEHVRDASIRAQLDKLSLPTDGHGERIAAEIERLLASMPEPDHRSVERAALQDVLEVERAARAFYLRFLEEVHDPQVAELFRGLAREEAAHIRIAEDALATSERKAGRPHVSDEVEMMLRASAEGLQ